MLFTFKTNIVWSSCCETPLRKPFRSARMESTIFCGLPNRWRDGEWHTSRHENFDVEYQVLVDQYTSGRNRVWNESGMFTTYQEVLSEVYALATTRKRGRAA